MSDNNQSPLRNFVAAFIVGICLIEAAFAVGCLLLLAVMAGIVWNIQWPKPKAQSTTPSRFYQSKDCVTQPGFYPTMKSSNSYKTESIESIVTLVESKAKTVAPLSALPATRKGIGSCDSITEVNEKPSQSNDSSGLRE